MQPNAALAACPTTLRAAFSQYQRAVREQRAVEAAYEDILLARHEIVQVGSCSRFAETADSARPDTSRIYWDASGCQRR